MRLVDDLLVHFSGDENIQIRYVVIDDLQLGGKPTVRDRVLGSVYGEAAVEEFLAMVQAYELERRGDLHLISVQDTASVSWRCHSREEVKTIYQGSPPRTGGLDPLPFFREMSGSVSGYRPWATL